MSTEAETINRAVALMRERAEAATPSPWHTAGDDVEHYFSTIGESGVVASAAPPTNAKHIASWHPAVALAVADWLEKVAEDFDENTIVDRPDVGEYVPPAPDATWCDYCGGAIASPHYSASDQRCDCYRWPTALAVARAYLGGSE